MFGLLFLGLLSLVGCRCGGDAAREAWVENVLAGKPSAAELDRAVAEKGIGSSLSFVVRFGSKCIGGIRLDARSTSNSRDPANHHRC